MDYLDTLEKAARYQLLQECQNYPRFRLVLQMLCLYILYLDTDFVKE